MLTSVLSLTLCHLRRFARQRQWCLLLVIITVLIACLQIWGKASVLSSTLTLLAVSAAVFILQAVKDRAFGFSAGVSATGVPITGLYISRAASAVALFVTLCALRSAVFYIL